ncbi:MAG: DinB family protein [Candidatus Hydrogenedentes bacterium]|nr:DinB family protein [Candidatus Hydrogenedentota bacterium]
MDEVGRIVRVLGEGNRRLQKYKKADAVNLQRSYAPGKWTGVQILAHVADSDMVCYTRLHQAIVEPSDTLFPVPMEGAVWMEKLQCSKRPIDVSLAAIHGARIGMIHTLQTLPQKVLLRTLKHQEMGSVSPLEYAGIAAEHGLHHLAQLDSLLNVEDSERLPK